jgi:alkanesulfonate monooxygenase SsuD/methylene tetrahydromethanopterin reductase-like flavin-dependent oxidoreductase (luciferase family)
LSPLYAEMMTRIGRERGWPPTTRAQFDAMVESGEALNVGSPQQVIDKILCQHELFGNDWLLLQVAFGVVPHKKMMQSIELLETVVAPAVREAVSSVSRQD